MCQDEAWIAAADSRCASGCEGHYDADKVRTYARHFRPNVIICDSIGT